MYPFHEPPNWVDQTQKNIRDFINKYRSMEVEIEEAHIILDAMHAPQDKTLARRLARMSHTTLETIVENLERMFDGNPKN